MKYSELIHTMDMLNADDSMNIVRLNTLVCMSDAGITLENVDELAPFMESLYEDYKSLRFGSRDFDDFCWAVARAMEDNGLNSPMELDDEQIENEVWDILESMGS